MSGDIRVADPSKQAVISACGRYRYRLSREYDEGEGTAVFIMLNPSTADALIDDPTIRKVNGFAQRWGRRRSVVVNMFGWRATDPKDLLKQSFQSVSSVVGPQNDEYILGAIHAADTLVLAWGAGARQYHWRVSEVHKLVFNEFMRRKVPRPMCLGYTSAGEPRHPLMLPYSSELELYEFKR